MLVPPVRVRDVEYLRAGDTPLLARIYEPAGPGPFPAVVDVHGGVWTTHDRLQNETIHAELAAKGIVVAALDFRMPPAAQYPLPVGRDQLRHSLAPRSRRGIPHARRSHRRTRHVERRSSVDAQRPAPE